MPSRSVRSSRRAPLVAASLAALAAAAAVALLARAPHAGGRESAKAAVMTEASMKRLSEQWQATHPTHGEAVMAAAADTFLVGNYYFDTDHNLATQVDTAYITTGQTVLFQWVQGFHNASDGDLSEEFPGSQWSGPLDNLHPSYAHTFTTAGTYGFQCTFHAGFFAMYGYVVVSDPAGVPPGGPARAGFVTAPWPNPTRAGVRARFALAQPGQARLVAYDAAGRAVATLYDGEAGAGLVDAAWDGRDASGSRAAPGVYFLRLSAPGLSDSRRVTIER